MPQCINYSRIRLRRGKATGEPESRFFPNANYLTQTCLPNGTMVSSFHSKPTQKTQSPESKTMQYPTVTTKLVTLLGNPLGHSVSPPMHNRVFQKLGIDYCYMPVEVSDKDLEVVFKGLTRMNVVGCNVTIPHKVRIIQYLDELDPVAEIIGAVNTICIKDGKSKGYNTDGEGFIRSLEEESSISVEKKRFFILGCGGAARAIAMTLAFKGAEKIYLSNRTATKAEELAEEINNKISNCSQHVDVGYEKRKHAARDSHIIINTTSLGMHPNEAALPLEEEFISSKHIVADIVYNPLITKLLKTAKTKGAKVVPGLGMLVYQGAAAFKLFTGLDPLVDEMSYEVHSLMKAKS